MTRSTRWLLLLLPPLCWTSPLSADWIEVDGEGILMGKVLSEDGSQVKFKGEDGKVRVLPRAKVLQLDRDQVPMDEGLEGRSSDAPASARRSGRAEHAGMVYFAQEHPMARVEQAVHLGLSTLGDYFRYDADTSKLEGRLKVWAEDLAKQKDPRRFMQPGRLPLRLAGAVLAIAGLVAAFIFAVRLIMAMFTVDFLWGALSVAAVFSVYAPKIGGPAGWALATVPPITTLLFVVLYWEAARKPFTCQVISLNVLLAGVAMLLNSL